MSVWWDDDAKKYRSTLPCKVFYVWGWPAIRWLLHNAMSEEQAHWFGIHVGIRLVSAVDKAWRWGIVTPLVVVLLTLFRLLTLLPGFTWTAEEGNQR